MMRMSEGQCDNVERLRYKGVESVAGRIIHHTAATHQNWARDVDFHTRSALGGPGLWVDGGMVVSGCGRGSCGWYEAEHGRSTALDHR